MEPEAIVHAFLGGLQLREPRGASEFFQVPLARQSPRQGGPAVIGLGEARRRGIVESGPAGLWMNRGDSLVMALPGQVVGASAGEWIVADPVLIPPHGEARINLLPAPVRAAARVEPGVPVLTSQCGAAVFLRGHLHAVAVMHSPQELADYLLRLGRSHEQPAPGTAVGEQATPLQLTRRLFDRCWYATLQSSWSAGPYRVGRLHAPKVSGWVVLAGEEVLALELRPRVERGAEVARPG